MLNRKRRTTGFTLVEFLVVICIVAMSLALAAPGIVRVRAQARANVCKNNLKMIALAMHNYHDTYVTFPPGWIAKDTKPATGACFGWGASILPFVDHAPLYNKLNFSSPPDSNNAALQTNIATYRCPDDTSADVNPVRDEFGTSNYSGNYGDLALPGSVDANPKAGGIFFWNSKVGIRDITDGTSNTFLVGERCVSSAAAIWVGVRSNQNAGDNVTACNHAARLNTVIDSFSSRHANGAYFVMCDGAVRFVKDEIDSQEGMNPPKGLYQKLANRNDGQAVGDF
jgi:prepilin-type processing-associated H-X9-DG protein